MNTRRFSLDIGLSRAVLATPATALLFVACACLNAGSLPLAAQDPLIPILNAPSTPVPAKHSKHKAPENPAAAPDIVIPTVTLGFAPPAQWYLGQRVAQLSLSFLDEDNLLFTFRVPGLIPREQPKPNQPSADDPPQTTRHIRALVLELPSGKVTAEALWELHDAASYLWPLKGGKFLLRDRNMVQMGDASLHLEPFLRFPGAVNSIQLPPDQRLLVTNTTEPPSPEARGESKVDSQPSTAAATISVSGHLTLDPAPGEDQPSSSMQDLIRILRMDTRTVMLFSRVTGPTRLPIDGEGYYEALRGNGSGWLINYRQFRGSSEPLISIDSYCSPALEVPASGVVLATACTQGGGRRIFALTQNQDKSKRRLWDAVVSPYRVWPQIASSFDGRRIARTTLDVSHPVGISSPVDREDIRSQTVEIYDLATGKVPLTVAVSPVLDGGGNVALSPSGKRFAVLNAGAIQIYDLPPAPDLPPPSAAKP